MFDETTLVEDAPQDFDRTAIDLGPEPFIPSFLRHMQYGTGELTDWVEYGDLVYGPRYHVETSQGNEVIVSTISDAGPDGPSAKTPYETERRAFLVALEPGSGRYLGHRYIEIRPHDRLLAVGGITTQDRGAGIGTALELACADYLQRLANSLGTPIEQLVVNNNLAHLIGIQDELRENRFGNQEMRKYKEDQFDKKYVEQKRWKGLYGPHGKLGFNERGIRAFVNQPGQNKPISSTDVYLRREYRQVGNRQVLSATVASHDVIPEIETSLAPTHRKQELENALSKLFSA